MRCFCDTLLGFHDVTRKPHPHQLAIMSLSLLATPTLALATRAPVIRMQAEAAVETLDSMNASAAVKQAATLGMLKKVATRRNK